MGRLIKARPQPTPHQRLQEAVRLVVVYGYGVEPAANVTGCDLRGLQTRLRKEHTADLLAEFRDFARTSDRAKNWYALLELRDNPATPARVRADIMLRLAEDYGDIKPKSTQTVVNATTFRLAHIVKEANDPRAVIDIDAEKDIQPSLPAPKSDIE